jgi:hypothetical protein
MFRKVGTLANSRGPACTSFSARFPIRFAIRSATSCGSIAGSLMLRMVLSDGRAGAGLQAGHRELRERALKVDELVAELE